MSKKKGEKLENESIDCLFDPAVNYVPNYQNNTHNPLLLIKSARSGISVTYLLKISQRISLSLQDMANILHVSLRTLQRYPPTKKLDTDASSKLLNLAALESHGIDVFGDSKTFAVWLRSPLPSLADATPLSYLDTSFGFELIDQILGRIEHGIFA